MKAKMGNPTGEFLLFWGMIEVVIMGFILAKINQKYESYYSEQKVRKHYGEPPLPERQDPFPMMIKVSVALLILLVLLLFTGALGDFSIYGYLFFVPLFMVIFVGGMMEMGHVKTRRRDERRDQDEIR